MNNKTDEGQLQTGSDIQATAEQTGEQSLNQPTEQLNIAGGGENTSGGLGQTSPTRAQNQDNQDDDDGELDEDKPDQPLTRQDQFVCFTNDKDLRHHETIAIKAQLFKGIAVKVKIMNHIWIEHLLLAIEQAPDKGIVNLRFEECRLLKQAVVRLINFCKRTAIIESLGLIQVSFDEGQDFKRLVEAVAFNQKIRQFSVQNADFNEDFHGKTMARCILESRTLKELDLSNVIFEDPKSFYEMANGLLNERCRLNALKLKGIAFGQLEGKVMQFILMRNKSLNTLDLSQCSTDSPENLENVFCKFDQFCTLKTLIAENLQADFNYIVEIFGEALGVNTKLEGLSLKENKLKQTQYCNFWELMAENRSLRKINVAKTEVTDKVCTKISAYLQQPDLRLNDLNLARNQISTDGLIAIAEALMTNTSLVCLNLAQNFVREGGIQEFVEALKKNNTLQELCLSFNKINNTGLKDFSGFLAHNSCLKVLDISRNSFTDQGFVDFARQIGLNNGIESLNLQKNKDVTDEVGLRELAQSLATNSSLSVIDLTGMKVRKPCVIQYFQPALKSNITLKRIIGKIPSGIINEDLKDNVTIESDITCKYKTVKKESRRELNKLPLHRIDSDQTQLDLKDQGNELLTPALKFIRYRRIHAVDLSNMQLEDESLRLLALYLEENPVLRSLAIADNLFTDDGLAQIIHALKGNRHLNHLNILGCQHVTDQSLRALEDMVTEVNMSLYAVELDEANFDSDLITAIKSQTSMNRAIQERLKPQVVTQDKLTEIKFDPKAKIALHFDSAIKAWRILGPTMIRAVNEGLADEHVEKLCQFLKGRELIQSLNLRRNKIGNKGAIAIADYVRKGDKILTSLELERNEIQDEGGEALLRAMQANMRMECCKMAYGNPLRQKICRQIEREIKANLQIKSTVVPTWQKNNGSLNSYKESDQGPDFVRCALKSTELFKILHLSLPDNMIGEKEMLDISYVISRNTPLRTLNLSDNVVDSKAALVLSESLGNNSNLKELDLRNNKLGDAGIAILMELFISQKLQKEQKKILRQQSTKSKESEELKESMDKDDSAFMKKSKKSRRLRMKLDRLLIDNNNQTTEALKHIYTALVANEHIKIAIDLPELPSEDAENSESSQDEDDAEDSQDGKKDQPINAIAPGNESKFNESERNEGNITPELREDEYEGMYTNEGEQDLVPKRRVPPAICRSRFCRPCRKMCFPDPSKPKEPWSKILCPLFLKSRLDATRFRISWKILTQGEQMVQKRVLLFLVASILLYIILGIVVPFLLPDSIIGYFAYCGFIAFSAGAEITILGWIRSLIKGDKDVTHNSGCNSYYIVKWLQGQLASLSTFSQICFLASSFDCIQNEECGSGQNFLRGLLYVLTFATLICLIAGNLRRIKLFARYAKLQPEVHKLLPKGFRNTQLAWLCNFYSSAVLLESVSLSEYMIPLGGPVVAGKPKEQIGKPKYVVENVNLPVIKDKLKYQDIPILAILVVYLFISMSFEELKDVTAVFAYIGINLLSVFSCYLSSNWERVTDEVDLELIIKKIGDRATNQDNQDEKAKSGKKKGKDEESSGFGSEKSDDDSSGLNNVILELENLKTDKNLSGFNDTQKLPLLVNNSQSPRNGEDKTNTNRSNELGNTSPLPGQDPGGETMLASPLNGDTKGANLSQSMISPNAQGSILPPIVDKNQNNNEQTPQIDLGLDTSISKTDIKQ